MTNQKRIEQINKRLDRMMKLKNDLRVILWKSKEAAICIEQVNIEMNLLFDELDKLEK